MILIIDVPILVILLKFGTKYELYNHKIVGIRKILLNIIFNYQG